MVSLDPDGLQPPGLVMGRELPVVLPTGALRISPALLEDVEVELPGTACGGHGSQVRFAPVIQRLRGGVPDAPGRHPADLRGALGIL